MRIFSYILMGLGILLLASAGCDEYRGITRAPSGGGGRYSSFLSSSHEILTKTGKPEYFHDAMVVHWSRSFLLLLAGFILFMIDRGQDKVDPMRTLTRNCERTSWMEKIKNSRGSTSIVRRQFMRYLLMFITATTLLTACDQRVPVPGNASEPNTKTSSGDAAITAKDAKNHVGEVVVVSGVISEIFVSSQTTNVYLYLDGDIKNAQFAAVWPGTNDPPIKQLKELIFKAEPISVSGKIITEKGVPEIIVSYWDQINR